MKTIITASLLSISVASSAFAQDRTAQNEFFYGVSGESRNMNVNYEALMNIGATGETKQMEGHVTSSSSSPIAFAGIQRDYTLQNGDTAFLRAKTEIGKSSNTVSEQIRQDITFSYMGFTSTQEVTTDISMKTDIYLSQSLQFGLSKSNWNGWSGYGSIGGAFGRYDVNIEDSLGMTSRSHGDMVIGEIGIGVEKKFASGMMMFAEYNYGKAIKDFNTSLQNSDYSMDANGSIEYDRIQIGLKYNF